ncbi:MAG: hydroxymethylglutaryl-CoA lyase, partial [Acidobacteria bacterium]|nr:hydroxymethylglutaryl-CoA lyase [Acidobacteriota bacterium]
MNLPKRVQIIEVAPRDGLQSLPDIVPTERKAELISAIRNTGISKIEITSFVHPKWVPQLADAEELLRKVDPPNGVVYQGLVANEKGYDRARKCPSVGEVHYVLAATETLNRKNANMSIADSMAHYR